MELTKEEHLVAHDVAAKLAEDLGVAPGANLRPLIEVIVQRDRAVAALRRVLESEDVEREDVEDDVREALESLNS